MSAPIIELADLVQTEVATLFPQAVRAYLPLVNREELGGTPTVLVVPNSEQTTFLTRHATQLTLSIDVGYIKALGDGTADSYTQADIDACMVDMQSIKNKLKLAKLGNYQWVAASNVPVYSRDHLEGSRQFFSVASFTFKTTVAP